MENQSQANNGQLVVAIPADQASLGLATDQHKDHENAAAHAATPNALVPNKKKRGGTQIVQAAMLLLRRRSKKHSRTASVDGGAAAPKSAWGGLVGSMRPLHLSTPSSPKRPLFEIANSPSTPTGSEGGYEDVRTPPLSPASSTASMQTPYASAVNLQELDRREDKNEGKQGATMHSRYASAPNLQELERSQHDQDKNKGKAQYASSLNLQELDGGEDEQIDARAEQFIAQFYQQMKLQGSD